MTRVPIPPLSGVPAIAGVTLRHWAETDVVPITAACQDAEAADYQDQYARNFIASSEANRMKGAALEVAVAAVGDGSVLGSVGLIKLDFANARGEVGYWIAPQARGRGVATAAVKLITGVGFDRLGLMRLDLLAATAMSIPAGGRAGGLHARGGAALLLGHEGRRARRRRDVRVGVQRVIVL